MTTYVRVGNRVLPTNRGLVASSPLNNKDDDISIMEYLINPEEKDDGKIGIKEALKSIEKGAKQELKNQSIGKMKSIIKHPGKTAAIVTAISVGLKASIAIFGMPAVMTGLGILGVCAGVKNIVKDVSNIKKTIKVAKNVKTDNQKRILMEQIGKSGINLIEDAGITAISALQAVRAGARIAGATSTVENTIKDFQSGLQDTIETASENLSSSIAKVDEIYNGKYDVVLAGTQSNIGMLGDKVNKGIDLALSASNKINDDIALLFYRSVQ